LKTGFLKLCRWWNFRRLSVWILLLYGFWFWSFLVGSGFCIL